MVDLMIMGRHVPVRRIVTAEGNAAGLAGTQVQAICYVFLYILRIHTPWRF